MKDYIIKRRQRKNETYQTMTIINRDTGETRAEYRLTLGAELAEIQSMRRALDRHLANPGATLGNYQF